GAGFSGVADLSRAAWRDRLVCRAWVRVRVMRVGIIAALPGELKPLVKRWRRVGVDVRGARKWVLARGEDTWIAVCAGMGAEAARRAFAVAESDGPLDMVLSVGWAGSVHEEVPAGSVQVPTVVIDAQTGEQF